METVNLASVIQQFKSTKLIATPDKDYGFLMTSEQVAKGYVVALLLYFIPATDYYI